MAGTDDTDMERLLGKYAGGRIPPLVDVADPGAGLLNPEVLHVYHRGLLSLYAVRLGFLLASTTSPSLDRKWASADFSLNERFSRPTWGSFCASLRERPAGQQSCEACDRRWAVRAEESGSALAYMCDSGLVDFATPVSVMGNVVAVLFCGQHKPSEDPVWNPELTWPNGRFRVLPPGEPGADAWRESQSRIQAAELRAGYRPGDLMQRLLDDVEANPAAVVTPGRAAQIVSTMEATSSHLSSMATSTIEVEKSRLLGWLREQVVRSLMAMGVASADKADAWRHLDTAAVWRQLGCALQHVARYFGLDYAMILSCRNGSKGRLSILTQTGLPEATFPAGVTVSLEAGTLSRLKAAVCGGGQPTQLLIKDYKEIPFFDWLAHKRGARALAFPLQLPPETPEGTPVALLVGRFDRDVDLSAWSQGDRDAFSTLLGDVSLVAAMVILAEYLREQSLQQAQFMEDVAHDIRNPLQIIMYQAQILATGLVPERSQQLAQKLAAQARRLDRMSQRVWTLQNIDRGTFHTADAERVSIYEIIMVARKDLNDMAEGRRVKVTVADELRPWPAIRAHKALFSQAILNLLDNAIKYSRPETEVRVDGKRTSEGVILYVMNRGVQIHEEDQARIFERYYRTNDAKTYRPEGAGIGLAIVKAFADTHGSVSVKSQRIATTSDYHTIFELFIRERAY